MYPVSDALKRIATGSQVRRARLTVLDASLNPVDGGVVTGDTVTDGQVYISAGSGARRTCSVTLANKDGIYTPTGPGDLFYWNRLIRIEQGILLVPGDENSVEWVPLGVFMVDRPGTKAETGGLTQTISGRDRWKMIDSAEYAAPGAYAAGTAVADVLASAAEYAGVASSQIVKSGTAHTLGVARNYEEGDSVGDLMTSLAASFGMRVYFNVSGQLVIEDVPSVASRTVVHAYQPGDLSIMSAIQRDLTDERFANHIVVSSASSDPNAPPPVRAVAEDTRAGSPTSIAEIGRRTFRFSSPMITTTAVAQAVADTLLEQRLRFSAEISIDGLSLPYLDGDDRVSINYPEVGVYGDNFLVESATMPLYDISASLRLSAAEDMTS